MDASKKRDINEVKTDYKKAFDLRGEEITVCICGSLVWSIKVIFEQETNDISLIFDRMECLFCGSYADIPIPKN